MVVLSVYVKVTDHVTVSESDAPRLISANVCLARISPAAAAAPVDRGGTCRTHFGWQG